MKYGVVDVGSNTIRLSIYHCEGRDIKLLLNKKEMAGLAGYVRDGVLSESGIRVACRVLSGYRALLDNFEIGDMHAFATASPRNIANTEEALEAIHAATGVAVEVLSGSDEARLSFLGAALGGGADSGLLADVGGGSTELVAYEHGAVTAGCSLPMGSLSLYTRCVDGLFPTGEERRAIRALVEEALSRAKTAGRQYSRIVGVGGTFRAARKLCGDLRGEGASGGDLPAEEIKSLYHKLKKGDKGALRQILKSTPDRVHTILPGLVLLTSILKDYGVETVSVSSFGVREGYLLGRVLSPREAANGSGLASHGGGQDAFR